MFFKELRVLLRSIVEASNMTRDLINGQYIKKADHEARVRDLLSASDQQMKLRRAATKDAEEAEHDMLTAMRHARESKALVKAVDWASEQFKNSDRNASFVFDAIKIFCMGYMHKAIPDGLDPMLIKANIAGHEAAVKDTSLQSAVQAAGLMGKDHVV